MKTMRKKRTAGILLSGFLIAGITLGNPYVYAKEQEIEETSVQEQQPEAQETNQEAETKATEDKSTALQRPLKRELGQTMLNGVTPMVSGTFGSLQVDASSSDMWVDAGSDVLEITQPGTIKITGDGTGSSSNFTNGSIKITAVGTVNITIDGVWLSGSDKGMDISSACTVNLTLMNDNFFRGMNGGVRVSSESSLTIDGTGSLGAKGMAGGTGIGGNTREANGPITINGGIITTTGMRAAGIGSGYLSTDGGNITINGGNITAGANRGGAGIGGSPGGNVKNITINGGTIEVNGDTGAGIGSGMGTSSARTLVENITINGGNIRAYGTESAAIGGGNYGDVKNITINGGNIVADGLAGTIIGGGSNGLVENIEITGGSIKTNSRNDNNIADIGDGLNPVEPIKGLYISGGLFHLLNELTIPVYNNPTDKVPVYGTAFPSTNGTKKFKVDGHDYKIEEITDPTGYSFFMTGEDHLVMTRDTNSDRNTPYSAVWNPDTQRFTFSAAEEAGDFVVVGGVSGTNYQFDESQRLLEILTSGDYRIYSVVDETSDAIFISNSNLAANVNLTIVDLNINGYLPGITLRNKLTKLTLIGENTIINQATSSAAFTVEEKAKLEIMGDGSLTCSAAGEAGIGGAKGNMNGEITIQSGTITASGVTGAGIGGSRGPSGRITINGGTVHAISESGAGIGGASGQMGGGITINGGNVIAESTSGAGIGAGEGTYAKNVVVNGGTVTAISSTGDGIGSGANDPAPLNNTIEIGYASVLAKGVNPISGRQVITTEGRSGAMYEIKNHNGATPIKVDDVEYTIDGNHPNGDTSYYLYMESTVPHTITVGTDSFEIAWYDGIFKLKPPQVNSAQVVETTTSSISVTATPQPKYGDVEYCMTGTGWVFTKDTTFENLKAGEKYSIMVRYAGNDEYGTSEEVFLNTETKPASYTISIPTEMTADGTSQNIAVNTAEDFVLGYQGKVNVKVTGGINSDGLMPLTRTSGTEKPTITSQLNVLNTPFKNLSANVATFQTKNDPAVPIFFAKPTGNIPAGSYRGTAVFTISYTQ